MKPRKKIILVLIAFLTFFSVAKAQNDIKQTTANFLPLPAVHITDVVINQLNNEKISGLLKVRNSENDELGGLHYQVLLMSPSIDSTQNSSQENYSVFDYSISPEVFAIPGKSEGEVHFSYNIPKVPAGNYVLRAQIITNKGTELGWIDHELNFSQNPSIPFVSILSKGITTTSDNAVTPWEGINTNPDEQIILRYEVKNGGQESISLIPVLNVWEFSKNRKNSGSFDGPKITVAPGKSLDLSFPVKVSSKPEAYVGELLLKNEKGERSSNVLTYRWVVKGASAEINVIRISHPAFKKDDLMGVTAEIVGPADQETLINAALEVSILNKDKVVGSQKTDLFTLNKEIRIIETGVKLSEDVDDPQIRTRILDSQGNVLEEDSFGLAVKGKGKAKSSNESKNISSFGKTVKYIAIFSVAFFFIVGLFFILKYLIKNRKTYHGKYTKISVLVLTLVLSGYFANRALSQSPAPTQIPVFIPFHSISTSNNNTAFNPIPSPPVYPFTFKNINNTPTKSSDWVSSNQGWWRTRSWKTGGSWCNTTKQPGCDTISGQRIFINQPVPGLVYDSTSIKVQYYIKIGACGNVPNFYHQIYAWWTGQKNWAYWINGKGNYPCPTGGHQCWTESQDFNNTISLSKDMSNARVWLSLWEYGTGKTDRIDTISDTFIDFGLINPAPTTTISLPSVLTGMALTANANITDINPTDSLKKVRWEITSRPAGSNLTFPGGNLTTESEKNIQATNNVDTPGRYCIRAKAQNSKEVWGNWSSDACADVKQLTCLGSTSIFSEATTNISSENGDGYELSWSTSGGTLNTNTGNKIIFTAPKIEKDPAVKYTIGVQAKGTTAKTGNCEVAVNKRPPAPPLSCNGPTTIFSGDTANFNVTDPRSENNMTYKWAISGSNDLKIDSKGTTATFVPPLKNEETNYTILVSSPGATDAQCVISVKPAQLICSGPQQIELGNSALFSVTDPRTSTNNSYSWGLSSQTGSLTQSGNSATYQASSTEGNVSITVTSPNALEGQCDIQIKKPPALACAGPSIMYSGDPTLLRTFGASNITNIGWKILDENAGNVLGKGNNAIPRSQYYEAPVLTTNSTDTNVHIQNYSLSGTASSGQCTIKILPVKLSIIGNLPVYSGEKRLIKLADPRSVKPAYWVNTDPKIDSRSIVHEWSAQIGSWSSVSTKKISDLALENNIYSAPIINQIQSNTILSVQSAGALDLVIPLAIKQAPLTLNVEQADGKYLLSLNEPRNPDPLIVDSGNFVHNWQVKDSDTNSLVSGMLEKETTTGFGSAKNLFTPPSSSSGKTFLITVTSPGAIPASTQVKVDSKPSPTPDLFKEF